MTPHAVVDAAEAGSRSRSDSPASAILLSCQGMRVSVDGTVLVDDVWFDIRAGEVYGLLGAEGAGKSTVLLAVCGLLPTDAGMVLLDGHRLDSMMSTGRTALVGHTMQEAAVLPADSVLANLRFWARVYGSDRVAEVMSVTSLHEHAETAMDQVSPGVRRALGIAVALLPAPRLIVLDEPTRGMDRADAERLLGIVGRIREQGTSVLCSGRRPDDVRSVCDRVGVLDHGRLTAGGAHRPAA
ncbi:ATP-binding cassette domain-containing protein [Actinophytocola sediminis]